MNGSRQDLCQPIRDQLKKLDEEVEELQPRVAALRANPDAPGIVVEALADWLGVLLDSRSKLQGDLAECERDPANGN
jgi:hypothetical protein